MQLILHTRYETWQKKVMRNRLQRRRTITFWLLLSPAILLFGVIMIGPIINMFRVSLLDWRGIVKPSFFIGLDNYTKLFQDTRFFHAALNTCIHLFIVLLTVLPLSFLLGFFISQRPVGYRALRTIFFLPGMLSAPALAMMFMGIYLPDGILNFFLKTAGLEEFVRVWLANKSTALGAIIVIDIWGGIGWNAVLFYAALSSVSKELFEAAQIDGANYWKVAWKIAFPICKNYFGVLATLLFLWILMGSAQNVLLLTNGGPGDSSITLGFYLFMHAFQNHFLGYSQAIGVFIFVIGIFGAILIRRVTKLSY
jgi:ABC-type sugar transport system permease subunit